MGLTRRDEEVEEAEVVDRVFKPRRISPDARKFKKKELIKPWSTKERFFVFVVFVVTILTSGILAISAREWKLPGVGRLGKVEINIPFFNDEPIIIEGGKRGINEKQIESREKIIKEFKSTTANLSGVYGLYVIDLKSEYSFGVYEDETFEAASLMKLPVMAAMFLESEKGSLNLETKYKLVSKDRVGGAGSLYGKPDGYEITYRNLVKLMGQQSDNTAFNVTKQILGEEKINSLIESAAMTNTNFSEHAITPKDIGNFFKELWEGNIVKKASRDEILLFLTDTIYENWLRAGLPDGTRLAHKYGREVHVVNDAGIVFSEGPSGSENPPGRRPYVVVIMSKGVVETEADEVFPKLSKIVFDGLSND